MQIFHLLDFRETSSSLTSQSLLNRGIFLPLTILISNFLTLEPTSDCLISLQCNFLAYLFVFISLSVIDFVTILLLCLHFGFSAARHVQTSCPARDQIHPHAPALEGEIPTTGLLGKSLYIILKSLWGRAGEGEGTEVDSDSQYSLLPESPKQLCKHAHVWAPGQISWIISGAGAERSALLKAPK